MSKRRTSKATGDTAGRLSEFTERNAEQHALLEQLRHVARVLRHSIHNNLSGRTIGATTTELGFARIADLAYPQVTANYANQFADGRQAKSISIGVRPAVMWRDFA